jgi:hypothetical protein
MAIFDGFIGAAYQAPSIYQDAQQCINWYPEIDPVKPEGARGVVALYPAPGLIAKITSLPAAEVRAMYVLPGGASMLVVVGQTLYLVSSSFTTSTIGLLNTSAGQVSICDNRIAAYLVDGANRYTYTLSTGAFATIAASDGAFTGADKCDYIDDFIVYNSPGSNQWAATSALSTVTPALSFSSKDSSSDNIVTLIADHREVFVIGERTTEVWVNVGAFPFPFSRIPGTSLQHGCVAKNTICRLGESIAWLSQDVRGQAIMIQLDGYRPKRISTHAIEVDIGSGVISDAIAFTYQQEGHEFLVLTLPTQDKTWVYDLATEMWHQRAWRDNSNVLHRHRANCAAVFQGLNLVGDYANGIIYSLDLNTYTDNGQPILRLRRTPHVTQDLKRIFYDFLQIQFQPGVGLSTGQGQTPQMMLRWSDDGGSTWSSSYMISIGAQGEYKNRAIKRKMGFARDRVFEVSITDPVKAVMISAELNVSLAKS